MNAVSFLTKTGLYCKLVIKYKPVGGIYISAYANTDRLRELHHEAAKYAQFEAARQQDLKALQASLNTILEILKHWTIGVPNTSTNNLRKSV